MLPTRLIIMGLSVVSILGYIWYITYQLDNALVGKKQAEDNIILVTNEFDTLHTKHTNLEVDYKKQTRYHKQSIAILKLKHAKDIQQERDVTKIKTEILNVKSEEDGDISIILSDTLNALRLLK